MIRPQRDPSRDDGPPGENDRSTDPGRRRFLAGLAVAGAAAWATPVVLSAPAAADGTACVVNTDLVVNGDASNGTSAWTPVLNGGVIAASIGPSPPAFEAGTSNSYYESAQTIDIDPDCGLTGVTATLSALLRGSHNGIASRVDVTWFAGSGGTGIALGTLTISRTATSFLGVTASGTVPAGTNSARVLLALHGHPQQTRGAADDISLVLG